MINVIVAFALIILPVYIYFDCINNKIYPIISFFIKDKFNFVCVKYRKFRKINKLVSTNYKGFFRILWISLCIVIKVLWLYIIQYLNNTVIQIEDNKYIITYVIKGRIHKMIVKLNRGPSKVLLVSDEKHEDVSHLILPYLGPEENFHNYVFTPNFFDRKELVFELSNGVEKLFTHNQNIILS